MERLYRSREDKMLGGVCGGIASYFNIDPVIIRLIFIFFLFLEGSGLLAYLVAWVIIPVEPAQPGDVTVDIEKEEKNVEKEENKSSAANMDNSDGNPGEKNKKEKENKSES